MLFVLCVLCSALYAEEFDYARADSLIGSAIYPVDSVNRVGDSVFMDHTIPIVPPMAYSATEWYPCLFAAEAPLPLMRE